ncbi:hypothetical protein ACSHE4_004951, partial [Escherichia coli]
CLVSDSMQLLDIVSLILFCGNEKQQPVTTSTSLNMQSPMQANLLVRFYLARSGHLLFIPV